MPILSMKRYVINMRLRNRANKLPQCSAVIVAAGESRRMQGVDKLFINVCGVPVLAHTLKPFQASQLISEIIIVTQEAFFEQVEDICTRFGILKVSETVKGGASRLESVINGVYSTAKSSSLIAIHDGARPCISIEIIEKTIMTASKYNAAAPGIPITSTVKRAYNKIITETIDRENLFEIQTPQIFASELIKAALTNVYRKSINVTDDCSAVELLGASVYITDGSPNNVKLTSPDDIPTLERLLSGGQDS